jgi:hypothetical protein
MILDVNADRLHAAFARAGDLAYGTYMGQLLRPLARTIGEAGLAVYPRLPGLLDDSREWGNSDESEQQRWFWSSVVRLSDEKGIGTVVTILHHDHRRFRLPFRPRVFGVDAVGVDAVEVALSRLSPQFAAAVPFRALSAAAPGVKESGVLA